MKKDILASFVIVLFLVFTTQGLKFVFWGSYFSENLYYAVCLLILLFSLNCFIKNRTKKSYNEKYITRILVILFLSEISKIIYLGGIRPKSMLMLIPTIAGVSTYFILKQYKVGERSITLALYFVGLITLVIQLYQFVFPEMSLFGIDDVGEQDTLRYGFNRTMPGCPFIAVYCLYYSWTELLRKFNIKYLLLFSLFLISLYLYLTRQLLVSALITLLYPLIGVKEKRTKVVFSIILLFSLLWIYSDQLFGAIISYSKEETSSWSTRMNEISYFLDYYFREPICTLFGYGYYNDDYGKLIDKYSFYLVDIGFIGEMVKFGVFYVLLYFMLVKKYLTNRSVYLFTKLFILSSLIHSLFIFPYKYIYDCFIWVSVLYIDEINVKKINLSVS